MTNTQLSLSELNELIGGTLEDAFPNLFWIRAEISEITINRSGHCYLELVEMDEASDEVLARGRATIWSYSFRMLKPYFETTTGQSFSEGIKVLVQAKVEYHPVYGMSLNIRDIDPAFTMGDMARKRREILQQLEQDGVLTMNQELKLPIVPQRIAIISSPTAAGLKDFSDQLANNPSGYKFYTKLFPAVMQGSDSPGSIMNALEQIFLYEDFFDVVAIIRGGGAQLDLASFDHYELAYHITQFPIPIITGIGHDKDETVTDLVAHTKLKTPTAVAEFLISGATAFDQHLAEQKNRFVDLIQEHLDHQKSFLLQASQQLSSGIRQQIIAENGRFDLLKLQLEKSASIFLGNKNSEFSRHQYKLERNGLNFLKEQSFLLRKKTANLDFYSQRQFRIKRNQLNQTETELKIHLKDSLKRKQNGLKSVEEKVRLVDPKQVLKRGYSLTYKNGDLLKSTKEIQIGDEIETQFADGKTTSKITKNKR